MDENTTRLVEQLKSNPAMLKSLMQSQDGRSAAGGQGRRYGAARGNGQDGQQGDADPKRGGAGGENQSGGTEIRPLTRL